MNASFVLQPGNAELEPRRGDPPLTTRPSREQPFPHQQLTQTAQIELQEELFARVLTLPGLSTGDSCVSVPGARAFILDAARAGGPAAAFLCETEFAHLHPPGDGSLHIALPPDVYRAVRTAEWGVPHPISSTMLVFGPRDQRELEIVWQIVLASYRFALGEWPVQQLDHGNAATP